MLFLFLGPNNVFTRLSVFFSEVAVVSFGGAYAVLAYVAQQAVDTNHWLRPGERLAGLGMAETTPGPLIMAVQYVGFLVGYRSPDTLPPLLAATLAGLLVTWVTFTPCFLYGSFLVRLMLEARLRRRAAHSVPHCPPSRLPSWALFSISRFGFGVHVIFRKTGAWQGFGSKLCIPVLSKSRRLCGASGRSRPALAIFRFNVGFIQTLLALLPRGGGGAAGLRSGDMTSDAVGKLTRCSWRGDR